MRLLAALTLLALWPGPAAAPVDRQQSIHKPAVRHHGVHRHTSGARAHRAPAWWVRAAAPVRWCESRGRYGIATGNGYFGAYQFALGTWHGVGGVGLPHQASPREQDWRAYLLWRLRGFQPWPVCGRLAGAG